MNFSPHTERDRKAMLERIGIGSPEELFSDIPESLKLHRELGLPPACSEEELVREVRELAAKNRGVGDYVSFLGGGAYDHFIPRAIGHLLGRSEFYTAYTPYQAELSQGLLTAIFEYQSLMASLTAMDVSNASLYDGATATAEAALMAVRHTGRKIVVISRGLHPEYREVLATYAQSAGIEVRAATCSNGVTEPGEFAGLMGDDVACGIVQNPNFFGCIERMAELCDATHERGALFIACVDPISLGILAPPGEYGADIAVGEGQGLGSPLSFGGPYLGFLTCREELLRSMPGRVVGATTDGEGRRGFVLTLQAREQHVRRGRATSNICSNEAHNSLAAAIYLSLMGKAGIREVAEQCIQKSHYALERLESVGFSRAFTAPFFKEFVVRSPVPTGELMKGLLREGFLAGVPLGDDRLLVAVTERRTRDEIDRFASAAEGLICRKN